MTAVASPTAPNLSSAAAADAVRLTAERASAAVAPLVSEPSPASASDASPSDAAASLTGAAAAIDLDKIGADEARKLMSAEHKALGYRPPPGSLAAEAQAAAAKHPDSHIDVPAAVLREAAVEDAARIAAERKGSEEGAEAPAAHAGIDLEKVGEVEARTLMSAEHKALGYRPPPGSLAAEAQAAAAKHPEASAGIPADTLREAAREDAARIAKQRDPEAAPTLGASIDLATVGAKDAAAIESAEHKALGYRPPATSLSAAAHAAAAQHPEATSGASAGELQAAGRDDALRIHEERGAATPGVEVQGGLTDAGTVAGVSLESLGDAEGEGKGGGVDVSVNLDTITKAEAKELQSEEQKILGYRPPAGSLAAEAQSAAAKHADTVATKDDASALQSEEQKELGQSLADKNEQDDGERKLGEAGL